MRKLVTKMREIETITREEERKLKKLQKDPLLRNVNDVMENLGKDPIQKTIHVKNSPNSILDMILILFLGYCK